MSVLQQLLPASFRGVQFYATSSSMESGRKQVTHEFPNSDRRFVEDLGRFQNIYRFNALITGTGADYTANKNALIQALEQEGIGLLVHPFFGTVSVVAKQFTVEENISRLGEAIFSLTFEKAEAALVPIGNSVNLSNLDIISDNVLDVLSTDIGSLFSLANGFPNNFTDAINLVNQIANAFRFNSRSFTQAPSSINTFNTTLNQYSNNANQLITNPPVLGQQTVNLFKETDNVIQTPTEKVVVYEKFYDFNNNQERVPPTTFERIQRQNNRDVLNGTIQAGSLVQSYRAATQIEFEDIRQLEQTQDILEEQYQQVILNPTISDNTKVALQELRNEARLFFESERLNVNQIDTITTNTQPLTVLAYQYYGDVDQVDKLAALNKVRNNGFVEGEFDILTG